MKKQLVGLIFLSLASQGFSQQHADTTNTLPAVDSYIYTRTAHRSPLAPPDEDTLTVTGVMYLPSPVVRSIADRLWMNEQVEMVSQMVDELRQQPHSKRDSLALANIGQTVATLKQQPLIDKDEYSAIYQKIENASSPKGLSEILFTHPLWSVFLLIACLLGSIQIASAVAGFCSGVVSRLWEQMQSERQLIKRH